MILLNMLNPKVSFCYNFTEISLTKVLRLTIPKLLGGVVLNYNVNLESGYHLVPFGMIICISPHDEGL